VIGVLIIKVLLTCIIKTHVKELKNKSFITLLISQIRMSYLDGVNGGPIRLDSL
jgi:hypothetical protein